MASIPDGPAKDGGKAVGAAAAAGMLAMRTGDHFDDIVPYVQPAPGPYRRQRGRQPVPAQKRRSNKPGLSRATKRRIAANIAKLPELLGRRQTWGVR